MGRTASTAHAATARDRGAVARLAQVLTSIQPPAGDGRRLVRASVHRGAVRLTGNVATAERAHHIRTAVAHVRGVRAVINELFDDDSLTQTVRSMLETSLRKSAAAPRVHVILGCVYLDWARRDGGLEQEVEAQLRQIVGVRGVVHGQWSKRWPVSAEATRR